MVPLSVFFQDKDDPPPFEIKGKLIDAGVLSNVVVQEAGMQSGLPSCAFCITLPNGDTVAVQQTARQMATLGRMLLSRYPTLLD